MPPTRELPQRDLQPRRGLERFALPAFLGLIVLLTVVWTFKFATLMRRASAMEHFLDRDVYSGHLADCECGPHSILRCSDYGPTWLPNLPGRDGLVTLASADFFDDVTIDERDLRQLAAFPELKRLRIDDCRWTEQGLAILGQFCELKELVLVWPRASNRGLAPLANLPKLEILELEIERISANDWQILGQLKDLKRLKLKVQELHEPGLAALGNLPNLNEFALAFEPGSAATMSDVGWQQVSRLPALETLRFKGSLVSAAALQKLATLPRLRNLALKIVAQDRVETSGSQGDLACQILSVLARFPRLERLTLSLETWSDQALTDLATLSHVDHLTLCSPTFTRESLANLKNLELRQLTVVATAMTPDEVQALANLFYGSTQLWGEDSFSVPGPVRWREELINLGCP